MGKHATEELQASVCTGLGVSRFCHNDSKCNSNIRHYICWVSYTYLVKLDLPGRGIHSFKLVGQIQKHWNNYFLNARRNTVSKASASNWKYESESEVAQSCLTLCNPMDTRLLRPWDFLGKSTGVGCHFLLHGIFPTQGSNPGLLCCRQTLYHLSHQGSANWKYSQWKVRVFGIVLCYIHIVKRE